MIFSVSIRSMGSAEVLLLYEFLFFNFLPSKCALPISIESIFFLMFIPDLDDFISLAGSF